MKKLLLAVLALLLVFALASCSLFGGKECEEHVDTNKDGKCDVCEATVEVPCTEHVDEDKNGKCDKCEADVEVEEEVMTYAEFAAAAINDEVTVITYVQAKQSWWEKDGVGVGTFYTQAEDGAYFIYEMPCSKAEYDALVPGTCIKVTGYKAEWSGEIEITDATFEVIADKTYIASATEITPDVFAGNDVIAKQNQLVALNNVFVKEAPMYKWDGSGSEGDDIYLTLAVGPEKTITVVVESYLHGNGSAVYEAVEALQVGQMVSIEAFLYWYNGAQPHVNKIVVEDTDFMSFSEFNAADLNSEVNVITIVQAKQSWWEKNGVGVGTFYTQDPDGAYFIYEMPCTKAEYDALVPGTCINVIGYKAAWSGEVEIIDPSFEIVYVPIAFTPVAEDITASVAAGADISSLQNHLVAIKNAVVAKAPIYKWDGSGSEGDDIYLTLTVGDASITVVVESYLHGNGSAVYEAVEALAAGDVVDIEAFLYWYNGAQPHVNAVVKK